MYHEKSQLYDMSQDIWLHRFIGSSCEVALSTPKKIHLSKVFCSLTEKDLQAHISQEHVQSTE